MFHETRHQTKMMKPGDVESGKKIFVQRCAVCHTVETGGRNTDGPNLFGIVGRKSKFSYTATNIIEEVRMHCELNPFVPFNPKYQRVTTFSSTENTKVTWSKETLPEFLADPKKYMPSTRLLFPGIKDPQDRADLIAYLEMQKQL
jgi:cytochrome c